MKSPESFDITASQLICFERVEIDTMSAEDSVTDGVDLAESNGSVAVVVGSALWGGQLQTVKND